MEREAEASSGDTRYRFLHEGLSLSGDLGHSWRMSCPICANPTETEFRPFCSRRCADIDLGRWMLGQYAIPVDAQEEEERIATQPQSPEKH